jgi:hypothetical protein
VSSAVWAASRISRDNATRSASTGRPHITKRRALSAYASAETSPDPRASSTA